MDDGPGLSCKPKLFSMRIILITHASSAITAGNRTDKLADHLSEKRVENTRLILESALREQLGNEVEIETIISASETRRPRIVDSGAVGSGNVEPLRRAAGGGSEDPELGRRINVVVEKIATPPIRNPGTYPLRVSAVNKNWHVTLQRLRLLTADTMLGTADLIIRNALSGKAMKATVTLSGGLLDRSNAGMKELPDGQPPENIAINYVSTEGIGFVTAGDMRFADFNNQLVRIEHVRSPMGVGSGLLCLTFDGLGDYARQLKMAEGLRLGLPNIEPFAVSGQLRMIGNNPGDYWVTDMTSYSTGEVEKSWRDSLSLTFSADNAELDSLSRTLLEDSAQAWGRRFWQ
jgi:hypothetical protein